MNLSFQALTPSTNLKRSVEVCPHFTELEVYYSGRIPLNVGTLKIRIHCIVRILCNTITLSKYAGFIAICWLVFTVEAAMLVL